MARLKGYVLLAVCTSKDVKFDTEIPTNGDCMAMNLFVLLQ